MKLKTCLYLFLVLLLNLSHVYAIDDDDDDDDPNGYEVANLDEEIALHKDEFTASMLCKKASSDVPDSNLAMETLEGGPSVIVAGCVNAITGNFFDTCVPLTIPGAQPLTLQCTYCSSEKEWNFQHMPSLEVGQSGGKNHLYARYCDDNGSGMTYRTHIDETNPFGIKDNNLTIPNALFHKGLTNCGSGLICGKTNWKNSRISLMVKNRKRTYELMHGTGVRRIFKRYKREKSDKGTLLGKFLLESETHPNGNRLLYKYDGHKLISVKAQNKAKDPLGEFYITYPDKHRDKMTWGGGGSSVYFTFEKGRLKQINRIRPDHSIDISYKYSSKSHHLEKKIFPDNRLLTIKYYDSGENKGRVLFLENALGLTHSFAYYPQMGETWVFDAKGNGTKYSYDKETKRIQSIIRCAQLTPLSIDKFTWHSGGKDSGNLFSRSFCDQEKTYFTRELRYDDFGNVTEDHLFGDLTGKFSGTQNSEVYIKTFRHSQDRRNLLLEENDQKKTLCCDYYSSLLLKHRLTKDKDKILKREFFTYDDNGVLIEEICDDGQTENPSNLVGITERHIKRITPRTEFPIGLPKIVEEYYFDLASNQKRLLKKTVYEHSPQGKVKLEEHYDSDGNFVYSLKWDYDDYGNVKEKIDALGQITTYKYDGNGNKVLEEGPRPGWKKEFVYDLVNNLKEEKEYWPNGMILLTVHDYNKLNQRTVTIDPNGHATHFEYDALGHLVKTTGPSFFTSPFGTLFPTEETKYDAMGNAIVHKDANGYITNTSYTIRGQPYRIEYPDGTIEQKEYSLSGLLIKEIDKTGLIITYTYDPFDRVLETVITDPQGNILKTKTSTYSAFQLLTETDEEERVTTYEYDGAGRRLSVIKGDHYTRYQYDSLGRVVRTIDSIDDTHERITCKEYDILDRVVEERIEDEKGEVFKKERYTYDVDGNKASVTLFTQAGTARTETEFYPNGKPSIVTDALGNKTRTFYEYGYAYKGQALLKITKVDPLGNQECKIHDTHGNVCLYCRVNPFGYVVQWDECYYDCLGRKTLSRINVYQGNEIKQGIDTAWNYNSMGNLTVCIEALGTPEQKLVRHHYNNYGQKEKTDMPNGISIIHEYDIFGRLSTYKSSNDAIHYQYTYDKKDNPILVKDVVHGTETKRIYDEHGRLKSETLDNGLTTIYTYDQLDRPMSVTLPDQSSICYRYNAHHLIAVDRIEDNEVVYTHNYDHYDLAGSVVQETLLGQAGSIHTQYDLLGRPIAVQAPHWQEKIPSHGFDAAGNLREREVTDPQGKLTYTYAYDDLYQLISENGCVSHTYQNDSAYNRIAKDEHPYHLNDLHQLLSQTDSNYHYDKNGNLKEKILGNQQIRYVYDPLDRLIEVHNGPEVTTYAYDSFHRRLSKTQNGETTHYLYHNQNEIGAVQQDKIHQLRVLGIAYGAEIGGAIAFELDGKTYAPVHDPQGNIVALVEPAGKLIENYRYSAFGEIQIFPEAAVDNPWRFSSKRFDAETGFVFFGRRYYDPEIGRWTTPDPAGFADGPNLYAYVHNHPLAYIDPDGQFAFLIALAGSLAIDMLIDAILPPAIELIIPYAGVSGGAFLGGLVKGIRSDFISSCPMEGWGMSIGAIIANKKVLKNAVKNASCFIVETVEKQAVDIFNRISRNSVRNIQHQVNHQISHQASQGVTQVTNILQKGPLKNAEKYLEKTAVELNKRTPSNKIYHIEEQISSWLGKETRMIKNEAGDLVLISKDGTRRIRYDFIRPDPHKSPHMHLDEKISGFKWNESGQIYPTDVPHH